MENSQFYAQVASVPVLALTPGLFFTSGTSYPGIFSGVAVLIAIGLMRMIRTRSKKTGLDDRQKVALVTSTVLYELLAFLGAFSAPVLSGEIVALLALAGIAFVELLLLEASNVLKTSFTHDIGREGRLLVLGASMLAYTVQPYYLFWGVAFIFLLTVYDSLRLLNQMIREV